MANKVGTPRCGCEGGEAQRGLYPCHGELANPRPRTPDPIDRKLSKRAWERSVQQWRIDLRAISDNMSTASDVVIAIVNGRDP